MASIYEFGMDTIQFTANGDILNLTKDVYEKPITNILLDRKRQNAFSLRSGIGQGFLLLLLPLIILLEVLARAIR